MNVKLVTLAVLPLVILGGTVFYLLGPGTEFLQIGEPLPELTVENAEFKPNTIIVNVRNTGPDQVVIAQTDVNDRPWPATISPTNILNRLDTATIKLQNFQWIEGRPYQIGLTISDGTRFAYEVEAAALSPELSSEQLGLFAILGSYVGIVPVMIGLLWFPFMRSMRQEWFGFFLMLTAGLLVFLGLDAAVEALEVESIGGTFNQTVLMAIVIIFTFLILQTVTNKSITRNVEDGSLSSKVMLTSMLPLSYMIAFGIGLHNLGEGLAIGASVAIGQMALSKLLIVGFTIHNTTEGLAIIAPISKQQFKMRRLIKHLIVMGLIAGAPVIVGTWIGTYTYSPIASAIFLAIGAGAIFQVVYTILFLVRKDKSKGIFSVHNTVGLMIGLAVMYLTSLIA